MPELQDKN